MELTTVLGISKGKTLHVTSDTDPTISKIGGHPSFYSSSVGLISSDVTCGVCNQHRSFVFVAQVYAPTEMDRTLYIFSCNKRKCSLQSKGWKVLRNQRSLNSATKDSQTVLSKKPPVTDKTSIWDFMKVSTSNSHDVFDDLEALLEARDNAPGNITSNNTTGTNESRKHESSSMVTNMISNNKLTNSSTTSNSTQANNYQDHMSNNIIDQMCGYAWPAYGIIDEEEPYDSTNHDPDNSRNTGDDNDMDDHIKRMYTSYLQDEEDKNLVQLLHTKSKAIQSNEKEMSSNTNITTQGDNISDDMNEDYKEGENEDLDVDKYDRSRNITSQTELIFQQKCMLQPRQVLRYSYGNKPLWCTYPHPADSMHVPSCPYCGSARVYEMQLMPSILTLKLTPTVTSRHTTNSSSSNSSSSEEKVNQEQSSSTINAQSSSSSSLKSIENNSNSNSNSNNNTTPSTPKVATKDLKSLYEEDKDGLEFGVVVIYVCPNSCVPDFTTTENSLVEEFIVVQPPPDVIL